MPIPDSLTFTTLRQQGDRLGEKRDCAVIAIAAISGHSYDTIHTLFHHYGRRPRCGVQFSTTKKVLSHLNLVSHEITKFYDPASVRSICPQLPRSGSFLIRTRGHIVAVVNGVAHDWSAMRKLYVQNVYQVLPATNTATTSTNITSNGTINGESGSDHHQPSFEPFPVPSRPDFILPRGSVDLFKPTYAVHDISQRLWERRETSPPSNLLSPDYRRWFSTFRALVVAECIAHGIHKTTASVQVGKWLRGVAPSSR